MAASAPVCAYRAAAPVSDVVSLWAFPPGTALLRNVSCTPNAELGRSHAWLPVTHTQVGDSIGLFFYYGRGCSDLHWDVGRTLLARNRAHLTVLLTHLAHRAENGSSTWDAAVVRAAAHLERLAPKFANSSLERARHTRHSTHARYFHALSGGARSTIELPTLLREAARGLFAPRGCSLWAPATSAARCRGACERRARALSYALWEDPWLDTANAALLRVLRAASGAVFDTVQLLQGGFRSLRVHTEIWDVRFLQRTDGADAPPCDDHACRVPPPHYGWPNGSRCALSAPGPKCWACAGSRLESEGCPRARSRHGPLSGLNAKDQIGSR